MHTMHPTLLIGPGDWDPQRIPRKDYDERLAALWHDHPNASGAIIYGNARDHAALAYLTHFTPKLEAAIALMPRNGEPKMLIGGGVNMLPAAKPLTFVSALAPLRDAAKTIADWAAGLDAGGSLVLLGGDAMPYDLRRALDRALSGRRIEDGDTVLQGQMRRKSSGEIEILRRACAILDHAVTTLREAIRNGKDVTDCVVATEHAAVQRGAQDVRSLFSLDGGRTLRPFDVPVARRCDPLQAYLAVRHDGYWADAFVRIGTQGDRLGGQAAKMLEAMIAGMKPGLSARALHQLADAERGAHAHHPLADSIFGSSAGLSLDEPPLLRRNGDALLEAGAVYSLRSGIIGDAGGAVASAIALVTERGAELLWPMDSLS
jgi:Xaa-Pro aminopeptidase